MVTRSDRRGIGALSKRTGCNIETIRYYERIGLMLPATRSEGGHRLYGEGPEPAPGLHPPDARARFHTGPDSDAPDPRGRGPVHVRPGEAHYGPPPRRGAE